VEAKIEPLPPSTEQIGADLGLTSMVITSKGEKVGNPRFFATDEKKLAKAQKRHGRRAKKLEEPGEGPSQSCQDPCSYR
jgi:putative transposase